MKYLLLLGALLFASPAKAALLDISGLADLISQKAKESRACSLVDLNGTVAAGGYLPVWILHDTAGIQYLDVGIGGAIKQQEALRPLITIDANLPALSGRLWSSQWAKDHLYRTAFPPIWFGPSLRIPIPGQPWTWKTAAGGSISIGFGGQ